MYWLIFHHCRNQLRKLWSRFSTLNDVKRKRRMMTLDANVLASSCCGTRHQRRYAAVAACNVFTPHHMDLVAISCLTGFTHGAEKGDEFKSVCPWDQSWTGWMQFVLSRLKPECTQAAAQAVKDKRHLSGVPAHFIQSEQRGKKRSRASVVTQRGGRQTGSQPRS